MGAEAVSRVGAAVVGGRRGVVRRRELGWMRRSARKVGAAVPEYEGARAC